MLFSFFQTASVFDFSASQSKWCLYTCAVQASRGSDRNVSSILQYFEEEVQRLQLSKEERRSMKSLELLTDLCSVHWMARLLVLYLCKLKNSKLSYTDWIRFQLHPGGRVRSVFVLVWGLPFSSGAYSPHSS
jgi:hypothetical protein